VKTLALNLLLATVALFMPIKAALISIVALVLLDLVTGIVASMRRKDPITSSGLKRSVVKIFVYLSVACLAFVVETFLTGDYVPLSKIMSGLIGITELKSVLENIESITGLPILQLLIDKLTQQQSQ
jgi:phage-related holin